ncbi:MAG: hypothetical protein U5K54_18985 [Cytophagales bacterium]|nr:hypothetical protein [Cytophagales bacterium]
MLDDQGLVTITSVNKDSIGLVDDLKKRNETSAIWLTNLTQQEKDALKNIFKKYRTSQEV